MSVEHMAMVYAAGGIPGPEKALLLAFTNFTDPHGYCWPGEDRLADMTGTSVRTVRRSRSKLIGMNLIKSVRRTDKATGDPITNLTRVNFRLIASMKRPDPVYDDNLLGRIFFDEEGAQDEVEADTKRIETSPDLLTGQSVLRQGTDCPEVEDTLTCGTGQIGLLSVSDPPGEAISRPSLSAGSSNSESGGKDGSGRPSHSPGVDLLLAAGADKPEFLLTGKTLTDQGLTVTGMLLEGWTEEQLRHVIAGRPLPEQVKTSVGAIVARRLRDAIASPPPASIPRLPAQAASSSPKATEETWTPPSWTANQGFGGTVATLPRAKCSECHRPLRDSVEDSLCRDCQEDVSA